MKEEINTIVIDKIDRRKPPSYLLNKIIELSKKNRVHIKLPCFDKTFEPNQKHDPMELMLSVMMYNAHVRISDEAKKTFPE